MPGRRGKGSFWAVVLMGIGLLLLGGASFWYLLGQNNPAASPAASMGQNSNAGYLPFPEIARVSAADARAAYETGTAVFVDVRGEPYYSQAHIPGALSITEFEIEERAAELDPGQWIITYCT